MGLDILQAISVRLVGNDMPYKDPEKQKAYQAKWMKDPKRHDKLLARNRAWKKKNREHNLERQRKYAQDNKDYINEYARGRAKLPHVKAARNRRKRIYLKTEKGRNAHERQRYKNRYGELWISRVITSALRDAIKTKEKQNEPETRRAILARAIIRDFEESKTGDNEAGHGKRGSQNSVRDNQDRKTATRIRKADGSR